MLTSGIHGAVVLSIEETERLQQNRGKIIEVGTSIKFC